MIDNSAMFKIGYGLYVISYNDGVRDNAFICNTVIQVTQTPLKLSVTINKQNYSHDVIKETKKLNINCLTENVKFDVFERFGFHSGRDTNKFDGFEYWQSENGLAVLTADHINAFISCEVTDYIDLGTHGMFICEVTDAMTLTNDESMTYSYYHKNVKPKANMQKKSGYVCKICGYVHEGDTLSDDFVCPICKHGASDFEKL